MEPNNTTGKRGLFYSHYYLGNYTKAQDALTKFEDLRNSSGSISPERALLLEKLGKKAEAEIMYRSLLKQYEMHPYDISIAEIYIHLRNFDKTFEWLEKAYEARNSWLVYIKSFPEWEPIRSDPRYKVLLKKMGLPEN